MLADKTGRHDVMERLLRQIMQRKPGYHHAYNALGYPCPQSVAYAWRKPGNWC